MEYFGSGVEVVPEGVGQLGTEFIGHAAGGAFDLVDQALEIGAEREMATTPRVAVFQVTASSSSATETLKSWRNWSLRERTT